MALEQNKCIGQWNTARDPEINLYSYGNLILFFFFKIYLFMYSILPAYVTAGQKRAPDLITDGCEPPCGRWDLNSGPLEEQSVLLTTEPSLQSLVLASHYVQELTQTVSVALI